MQKIIFTIFLITVTGNFGCGNIGLAENQDATGVQPTTATNPTPAPTQKGEHSKEYLEHFDKGVNLSTDGSIPDNHIKAIEEFEKAGEIDPTDTAVYWRMTQLYNGLKDYDGVVNCYREIIKRNPEETNAQYGLAQVLVENLKNYDEGLKESLIAQEKKASYTWAIAELLGKAYEGKGDIPNALKQYKQYLRDFRGMKDTDSTLYKDMQKKVTELEKTLKNSNQNSNNSQKTQ